MGFGSLLGVKVSPLSWEILTNSLSDRKQAATDPRESAASEKPSLGFRFRLRIAVKPFSPGKRVAKYRPHSFSGNFNFQALFDIATRTRPSFPIAKSSP